MLDFSRAVFCAAGVILLCAKFSVVLCLVIVLRKFDPRLVSKTENLTNGKQCKVIDNYVFDIIYIFFFVSFVRR